MVEHDWGKKNKGKASTRGIQRRQLLPNAEAVGNVALPIGINRRHHDVCTSHLGAKAHGHPVLPRRPLQRQCDLDRLLVC